MGSVSAATATELNVAIAFWSLLRRGSRWLAGLVSGLDFTVSAALKTAAEPDTGSSWCVSIRFPRPPATAWTWTAVGSFEAPCGGTSRGAGAMLVDDGDYTYGAPGRRLWLWRIKDMPFGGVAEIAEVVSGLGKAEVAPFVT